MADRQPRAYVNGLPVLSVEVSQSRTKNTDTFHAELPMSLGGWDGEDIAVQVTMSNDGPGGVQMFDGFVDSVEADFAKRVYRISGRDKGAKLIDKKDRKKFLNKKPGEVVQQLAGEAGLSVDMDEIGDKAGKIYQIDWNAFQHDHSHWSMINRLADLFGMNAYVTNGTLYFKNMTEEVPTFPVFYVPPTPASYAQGSFIDLKCRRNLVVSKGAKVTVKSWNHKLKKVITSTKGSKGPEYKHHHPGLTQAQADKIAAKKLRENSAHGKSITLDMPGNTGLNARMNISISGTGSIYDDTYEITTVQYRMSFTEGFRMTVSAKSKGSEG